MAERTNTYEDFMNAGHAAAWDQDWPRAIKAYTMAIKMRPDSPSAYNSLGLALLQVKPPRLEESLRVYQRSHKLDPDDPLPLEKSADVYERMGRLQDAAKQYLQVAEAYLAKRDIEKAIGNWERATRVTPGLVRVHQKLALAYERIGNTRQAVREYLTLAANFHRGGKTDVAIQAVERALRLEPRNPQALNTLQALRAGGDIPHADERLRIDDERQKRTTQDFDGVLDEEIPEASKKGPIGDAVEQALERLALFMGEGDLMSDPNAFQILQPMMQAIEYHRVGAVAEATGAYQRAESAGLKHPAMYLCLGSLFVDQERYKEAILYLERAAEDEEFNAGACHGLGIAHMMIGRSRQATRYLIRTMQLVDVGLALNEDEMGQLGAVYDRLLQNLGNADEATLISLNERFFNLLTGADWKQRVELTRHQLEDAINETPDTLLDVAAVSPEIVESMNLIDQYIRARRYTLAMEEAYHVIQQEPDYLAAHIRIGQILMHLNQLDRGIEKYRYIVETYLSRDNRTRAMEILQEVIRVAPMNTGLRQDLIEMLEEEERWDDILDQYLSLANAYRDLGDSNNTRTTLNQAYQLAQRTGASKERTIDILHQIADVEMMRLEVRPALRAYENIRNLEPGDETARQMIIELNYRLGDPQGAIRELDGLLQHYARQRNGRAILELLSKWVEERPEDESLRLRLASVFQQIKRADKALEHYDELLELQLKHGRQREACQTIKRILALRPSRKEHYLKIARQLGCT